MDEMESLSHTKWECKYHVVFILMRRCCTGSCGSTWEKCSASWLCRRRVESKKGICCPITCT